MDIKEHEFIMGFNNGYLIAKYQAELLKKVVKNIMPKNNYFEGFLLGKDQYYVEKTNERLKDLKDIRIQSKNREIDFDRNL